VEAITVLVQLGADKEAKSAKGRTALLWAAFGGHIEAIKLLAEMGARRWMQRMRMDTLFSSSAP
jgi:ankyrin repeat protein